MSSMFAKLEGLDSLARRDGVDIRPTLVRVLTDLYVQKPSHSAEEERHYTELALRLIDSVDLATRMTIAKKLGADDKMAEESGPDDETARDPDYATGGSDSLTYRVPLADIKGTPAALQATLYYQATPPFYLQDRFCTSNSDDTKRLYYVAGKLSLAGTAAQDWKLRVVTSGPVTVP